VARDAAQHARSLPVRAIRPDAARGEKGVLRQILAQAETARGAVRQRADERLIARHNLAKRLAIARQAGVDQFRIRVGGHGVMLVVIMSAHQSLERRRRDKVFSGVHSGCR